MKEDRYTLIRQGDDWACTDFKQRTCNVGPLSALMLWLLMQINTSTHELRIRKAGANYAVRIKRVSP